MALRLCFCRYRMRPFGWLWMFAYFWLVFCSPVIELHCIGLRCIDLPRTSDAVAASHWCEFKVTFNPCQTSMPWVFPAYQITNLWQLCGPSPAAADRSSRSGYKSWAEWRPRPEPSKAVLPPCAAHYGSVSTCTEESWNLARWCRQFRGDLGSQALWGSSSTSGSG